MGKAIDRLFPIRFLQIAGLSLALVTASATARAETVIGTDGTAGADCDPLGDPFCVGGGGGRGGSAFATGNPAVAYGGMGGRGGFNWGIGSGAGGEGGSATAEASGGATTWASATGGAGGWAYSGDSLGGDATASATASSGDMSVYATAWAQGQLNPGLAFDAPTATAYAYAAALPYGDVPKDGEIVFGIATVDANGSVLGFDESFDALFYVGGFRGDLFLNGFALGPAAGPYFDPTSYGIYGPGTFILSGAVPEPSTWAMMLLGFAGLGFAGYRASRRTAAVGLPPRIIKTRVIGDPRYEARQHDPRRAQ